MDDGTSDSSCRDAQNPSWGSNRGCSPASTSFTEHGDDAAIELLKMLTSRGGCGDRREGETVKHPETVFSSLPVRVSGGSCGDDAVGTRCNR